MFQRAKKLLTVFLFSFFSFFKAYSQQSLLFQDSHILYHQGIEYFEAKNFLAAKESMRDYLETLKKGTLNEKKEGLKANFYINLCNVYLDFPEAETSIQRFVQENIGAYESIELLRELGLVFYDKGNFKKAIEYLELSANNHDEASYKLGMSYYELKNFDQALNQFARLSKSKNQEYSLNAAYYAAILEYNKGRFSDAISHFKIAEGNSKYRAEIPNWISKCFFKQGKFKELVDYANPFISNPSSKYKIDELIGLVAQVQYQLDLYEAASKNFEKYFTTFPSSKKQENLLNFGFSLYKINQFSRSSLELSSIANKKDSLGQLANYYIGLSQYQLNHLDSALISFEKAKSMDFDTKIKEESWYQYGRILIENNQIIEGLKALGEFNTIFPNSDLRKDSYKIAAQAILKLSTIQPAENYLKTLDPIPSKLKEVYQLTTYNLGAKAYNDKKLEDALGLVNKAIENNQNENTQILAKFLKGEIFSQTKKFAEAATIYENLLKERTVKEQEEFEQEIRLSLAYAYFSLKNFDKANPLFKIYVDKLIASGKGKSKNSNVILRLADTYLIAKKYQEALNYYQQAYKSDINEKDYALFQIGLTNNYLNRSKEAIDALKKLKLEYPKSPYIENALYQESLIAFNLKNYLDAIDGFTEIIDNQKGKEYYFNALLYRAQAYINLKEHTKAISELKSIIQTHPAEEQTKDALYALQEELNLIGKGEDFTEILSEYKKNSTNILNGDELEELEYNSLRNTYLSEKFANAIEPMMAFVENNPNSKNKNEIIRWIADGANRVNNKEIARDYYEKFVNLNPDDEQSKIYLEKIVQLSQELNEDEKAIETLLKYKKEDLSQEETNSANQKLIDSYIKIKKLDSAAEILQEFTNNELSKPSLKANYSIKLAKEFLVDSTTKDKAVYWLKKTTDYDSKGDIGAEAEYSLAEILSLEGKYQASVDLIIEKFQNDYAEASELIVAKAFILLANNFKGLGNQPQALATIQSIIDNSENKEVQNLAKEALIKLNLKNQTKE